MIHIASPKYWQDYELIDCGNFEKLERFGQLTTIRPEPQAVWNKRMTDSQWQKLANVHFMASGNATGIWKKLNTSPDNWQIAYKSPSLNLNFKLALTSFKHVGVFPEQADNWEFIYNSVKQMPLATPPRVLNLFAYTGGASLAAKQAGADVVHLDSIKQVVNWASENMKRSHLDGIRWVVEDAKRFVQREAKRGNIYQGIILDPPAYGIGTNGERWKLENDIAEMLADVAKILDPKHHFLVLNTYSLGFSALIIQNLLEDIFADKQFDIGELCLSSQTKQILPLGVFARRLFIKK